MEDVKKDLKLALQKIAAESGFQGEVILESSKDLSHGDFSTSIALKMGKYPMAQAEEIKDKLGSLNLSSIDKIEVAAPGFINFYLSKDFLSTQLAQMLVPNKQTARAGQTILVEYTDPNPFKEMHVGHLYSNAVGESLARILEYEGNDVKRLCYQGDVGLHVAKAIYGMKIKLKENKTSLESLEKEPLSLRVKFLGEAYALGSSKYEEDESVKIEINNLNKKIYEKDPETQKLYEKGRNWSLEHLAEIAKRLGTSFDKAYFESETGPEGLKIVEKYLRNGIFEKSDNAIIFDGEKYGLHKRVFVNSQGIPTYEAKDLALAISKKRDFDFNLSIIVTANEQNDYFKVLLKALSQIDSDLAKKTLHIGHGIVKLPQGKISSRTGGVPTAEGLLDEARSRLKAKFPEMEDEVLEKVTIAAVKYALLKVGIGKDVVFDFEKSISLEGDSGPYLQYTFVRTQSVIAKSGAKNIEDLNFGTENLSKEEDQLLRNLVRFDEVVKSAAKLFTPNLITTYLIDLASQFNLFYQKLPIISREKNQFRLALTAGVGQVIKEGLNVLGIEAPNKM